jgi:toxin ParE1/3/4
MSQYQLSSQAQQSLIQISQYTLENSGPRQKKNYLTMLRDRMRAVAKNPEKGMQRNEIKIGYYSVQAEKHHIYYRIRDTHIEVIDVLHQSMEPKIHLG